MAFARSFRAASILAAGVVSITLTTAGAEDGIGPDQVLFGQAAVLEGPASALGQGMRAGIQAAFEEANTKGGVHGRKLKLVSVDDGYEPDKSIAATRS